MKPLTKLSEKYLEHCQYAKNLSEHSIRAYQQDLGNFEYFLSLIKVAHKIETTHIEQFARYLNEKKELNPRSIKRKLACLSSFFNWLEHTEEIDLNPMNKANISLKYAKPLPKAISKTELKKLAQKNTIDFLSFTKHDLVTNQECTNLLAILLMACSGIRVGELVKVTLTDIDIVSNKIKIHGKGSRERFVFITDEKLKTLFNYYYHARLSFSITSNALLLNSRGKALTTQTIRLRLKKASSSKINKKITPHVLRHTAATLLIEQGVDIRFVQKLLGHQSITTTEIYTHVSDSNLMRVLKNANHLEGVF